jgi:hypothetical protein
MKALNALAVTTTLTLALAFSDTTSAQDTVGPDRNPTTVSDARHDDEGFNYGWLGLAGLLGLLGLMPRNRGVDEVTVRDGAGNVKKTVRT